MNGETAERGAWPWIVSLHRQGDGHYCGGSIITKDWILSAAHCFRKGREGDTGINTDTAVWEAHVGEHELQTTSDGPHVVHKIQKIIAHHHYRGQRHGDWFDLVLLKVETPIEFGEFVQPICLAEANDGDFAGNAQCYAAGWGSTERTTGDIHLLQQLHEKVWSNVDCAKKWSKGFGLILDEHICFGSGRRGTCSGDSGGPLMCKLNDRWRLTGVTSWGPIPCVSRSGMPGVFIRVSEYKGWIDQILANN